MLSEFIMNYLGAIRGFSTTTCLEAARKSTRARKRAILLKNRKPITKKEAAALELKRKMAQKLRPKSLITDISSLPVAVDDVFRTDIFRPIFYDIPEIIAMHREYYHPTMYDNSNCYVSATVELDLTMDKRNKFLPKFNGVTPVPYPFLNTPKKSVLVMTKSEENKLLALEHGADRAGGPELVKLFQEGALLSTSFSYVIVSYDMAGDISSLRGILRNRFPTIINGLITNNLPATIRQFQYGMEFESSVYTFQDDYGTVVLPFGRLTMDLDELRSNLVTLLNYVESRCPRNHSRPLISNVKVWCEKECETFYLSFPSLMQSEKYSKKEADSESVEEVVETEVVN